MTGASGATCPRCALLYTKNVLQMMRQLVKQIISNQLMISNLLVTRAPLTDILLQLNQQIYNASNAGKVSVCLKYLSVFVLYANQSENNVLQ